MFEDTSMIRPLPFVFAGLMLLGCGTSAEANTGAAHPGPDGKVQVKVDGEGYHPSRIETEAGRSVTLVFTRTTNETCGQEVVIPSEKLRKPLPLNVPVSVALKPARGEIAFTCGMNMYKGSVVAR